METETREKFEFCSRLPIFESCSNWELLRIAKACTLRHAPQNQGLPSP